MCAFCAHSADTVTHRVLSESHFSLITHVGIWARTMLGQDKLSELKEMTAEYHESSPIPIESWQPADWVD